MHLAFFYDQSQFVRDSVGSVWDAIIFGLILSVFILYFFLKNWGSVWTAIVTIPITVLITFVAMKLANMSFNMMTLGGIAASIGLIIDNAIVVVEAMCAPDRRRPAAAGRASRKPSAKFSIALIGSTLTPVVVFLPLAFLTGVAGRVFPRAGADDGRVAAGVAGSGAHADAVAGRVVHPRARKNGARPRADRAGRRIFAEAGPPDLRTRRARGVAARLADAAGVRAGLCSAAFSFTSNWKPISCPILTKAALSLITRRRRAPASPKPRAS